MFADVIKQVSERVGLNEQQSETAVRTVGGFLKEKLPEPIADQVDNVLGTQLTGVAGQLVDIIVEKTGISENQAEMAVRTVADYLHDKLPEPLASQLYPILGLSGSGGIGDQLGGLLSGSGLGGLLGGNKE